MENAIEIKGLRKRYEKGFELGEINLEIPQGIICGLIGENGAGKTTLIKSMLSIVRIDSGTIRIYGKDTQNTGNTIAINSEIGVVLDGSFFPELLTGADIDLIMSKIYANWDKALFYKYLADFNIPPKSAIKTLSKGMRKKLEIATAISHHPKLLILDEPTSGLDPVVRSEVLDIFIDFIQDEHNTILLSTHITSDLERIADKIVFIDEGKVSLNSDRDTLLDTYGVLKCDYEYFDKIDKSDVIAYKKNRYDYEVLIGDRNDAAKKYADCIIDKITLEDLMILLIKGEKV